MLFVSQIDGSDDAFAAQSVESERDMLIEQLKTAEMAIMSMMNENNVLKKQATADREVCCFSTCSSVVMK